MTPMLLMTSLLAAGSASTTMPFDLAGRTVILTAHASGAQIYDCRSKDGQAPVWTFREPIATLVVDGKTVGRHYAGPSWALDDGSVVTGKQADAVPGAAANDIPQLKLDVVGHLGHGKLDAAAHVYRVETRGGKLSGSCQTLGGLQAVPYSATYVFTN